MFVDSGTYCHFIYGTWQLWMPLAKASYKLSSHAQRATAGVRQDLRVFNQGVMYFTPGDLFIKYVLLLLFLFVLDFVFKYY